MVTPDEDIVKTVEPLHAPSQYDRTVKRRSTVPSRVRRIAFVLGLLALALCPILWSYSRFPRVTRVLTLPSPQTSVATRPRYFWEDSTHVTVIWGNIASLHFERVNARTGERQSLDHLDKIVGGDIAFRDVSRDGKYFFWVKGWSIPAFRQRTICRIATDGSDYLSAPYFGYGATLLMPDNQTIGVYEVGKPLLGNIRFQRMGATGLVLAASPKSAKLPGNPNLKPWILGFGPTQSNALSSEAIGVDASVNRLARRGALHLGAGYIYLPFGSLFGGPQAAREVHLLHFPLFPQTLPAPTRRFVVSLPSETDEVFVSLSPDSKRIAYLTVENGSGDSKAWEISRFLRRYGIDWYRPATGTLRLLMTDMDGSNLREIVRHPLHETKYSPTLDAPRWTPDSRAVSFFCDRTLYRVDLNSGSSDSVVRDYGLSENTRRMNARQ